MEELDLMEIFNLFNRKKVHIIIITLLCIIIGIIYSYKMTNPQYKSSTTMVLANNNKIETANTITQTDLNLNQTLISTYSELIKSKSVLSEVIKNLGISELNEESLKESISVTNVTNTELINISIVNDNPEYSKKIADEIAKVFSIKILEIYNISNVYVVDEAKIEEEPYNINHKRDIMLSLFIGLFISFIYTVVSYLLDNTVKTTQDIEKITKLPILATVPLYKEETKKRRKE